MYIEKKVIGDATLYLGDCLDILPTLDPVDCILCDTDDYFYDKLQSIVDIAPQNNVFVSGFYTNGHTIPNGFTIFLENDFSIKKHPKLPFRGSQDYFIFIYKGTPSTGERKTFPKTNFHLEEANLYHLQGDTREYKYVLDCFSAPGETILDFNMGAGSVGLAAIETGRKFIGIEINKEAFDIAVKRFEKRAQT